MNAKTAVINNSDKQFLESQDVTLPTITAAGYEFGGWSLVTDDVTADATIDGWNAGAYTADVTLWARMTPVEVNYTVKTYFLYLIFYTVYFVIIGYIKNNGNFFFMVLYLNQHHGRFYYFS